MSATPRKRLIIAATGITLLVAGALLLGGGSHDAPPPRPPVKVSAYHAMLTPYTETLSLIGTARARESAALSTQTTEKIAAIYFQEGAEVTEGDVLVSLEQRQESAASEAARIQLADAQRQYERVRALSGKQVTSRAALDNAASALAAAKERLAATNAGVRDRTITAPFDGVLGTRNVSVGTVLEPGDVVTTIDAIDIIRVDMDAPERFLPLLRVGQTLSASSPTYPGETFSGTIDAIESRVDPASRSVRVRGIIDNPSRKLRPGMLLDVSLATQPRDAYFVPEEALVPIAKREYVFLATPAADGDQGRIATRVQVTTGARHDGMVEIISGLTEGDTVITEGQLKLSDGQSIALPSEAAPAGNVAPQTP